jgi:hypothetical protein
VGATLGAAYALSGQADAGLALLERAVARGASMGMGASHSVWVSYLGEAQLVAGRPNEARRSGERALASARAHRERGYEAWALRLLGEIAARNEPPDAEAAAAYFGDAIAIGGELGMRPLLALTHWGLGRALRQHGDATRAAEHQAVAADLIGALDMPTWRAQILPPP